MVWFINPRQSRLICLFISLKVKAVHLEAVSDLTSEAFISALQRFVARWGCPMLILSDHGTNFVSANRELKEMFKFLSKQDVQSSIADFCSNLGIEWKFIPEHSPHFGGLWEAGVNSTKKHLRYVVGDTKLTFEELSTVLAQIEACCMVTHSFLWKYQMTMGLMCWCLGIYWSDVRFVPYLIHHLLTSLHLCWKAGIYARTWFDIFGGDGPAITWPYWIDSPSGSIWFETLRVVTLWSFVNIPLCRLNGH